MSTKTFPLLPIAAALGLAAAPLALADPPDPKPNDDVRVTLADPPDPKPNDELRRA